VLPQIAIFISIELGACILKELVFDKRAELGSPIVICAGNNLPGEVRVTSPPAGAKVTEGCTDVDTRGFRIVNAHARPDIRLEPAERESRDEVPHKRTSVNPGTGAAAAHYNPIDCQVAVSAAFEPVVKEVPFDRRTKYPRAKDVTEFDATKKTDLIFGLDRESGGGVIEVLRKSSGSAAVLVDICARVNRALKTESVKFRR